MIEADFGDQALKADPSFGMGARLAQIVVNHDDPIRCPPQVARPHYEAVLEARGLLVIEHLLWGGLADVDDG
jgi:hypothetical protein